MYFFLSQTPDCRLRCVEKNESFWLDYYTHIVVRSCRDQLLAKWNCVLVRFGTLKESLAPWSRTEVVIWCGYRDVSQREDVSGDIADIL